MTSTKYIGMDVHKESISIAVRNDAGKIVMECVVEPTYRDLARLRGHCFLTGDLFWRSL
jgi:hypothetical protein